MSVVSTVADGDSPRQRRRSRSPMRTQTPSPPSENQAPPRAQPSVQPQSSFEAVSRSTSMRSAVSIGARPHTVPTRSTSEWAPWPPRPPAQPRLALSDRLPASMSRHDDSYLIGARSRPATLDFNQASVGWREAQPLGQAPRPSSQPRSQQSRQPPSLLM